MPDRIIKTTGQLRPVVFFVKTHVMNPHEFQLAARQFRAGKISLSDFTSKVFPAKASQGDREVEALIPELIDRIRKRPPQSHKGNYGRLLLLAGSPGMSGAAALAGMAALRCGAGLVTVATDHRCQGQVASYHPSLMTLGMEFSQLQATVPDEFSSPKIDQYQCLAMGPGLGMASDVGRWLRDYVPRVTIPMVIDADGLNHLSDGFDFSKIQSPTVFTPHAGEMKRLMDHPSWDRKKQEAFANDLALRSEGVVVLKGPQTLITDGQRSVYNSTGNPGMATAGSGDVLTGMISALIGQGLSAWESSVLGCYLHGRAGDIAATENTKVALVSTDIIEFLPEAIKASGS